MKKFWRNKRFISFIGINIILALVAFYLFILNYRLTLSERDDPNIILITVDTLRPDHMGIYGYNKKTTPYVDAWSKNAFVFTNVVTNTPSTYPSIVSLMTGLNPLTTKIIRNNQFQEPNLEPIKKIDAEFTTLAQFLKTRSYHTAAFIVNEKLAKPANLFRYFDEYHFLPYNEYSLVKPYTGKYTEQDYVNHIKKAARWIEKNKNKKFFLWVHLWDPHHPYMPPEELRCKFNKTVCDDLAMTTVDKLELSRQKLILQKCVHRNIAESEAEIYKTLYDGEIALTDSYLEQFFSTTGKSGLNNNTLFILTADHGEGFDHNYYYNHAPLYNSNIKIPLIIKSPRAKLSEQVRISKSIQLTDITPTILDFIKYDYSNYRFDGRSFNQLLDQSRAESKQKNNTNQPIYGVNYSSDYFYITEGKYKYIMATRDDCLYMNIKEELYEIKSDPDEINNILFVKPKVATRLKTKLVNYLKNKNLDIVD